VYFSNDTLLRHPPWSDENIPAGLANFLLVAGDAVNLELVRDGQAYQRVENDGSYVMYLPAAGVDQQMPVITSNELSVTAANNLYGGSDEDRMQVLAVVITALCQADSCSYR
jgi:hypothetical protein